MHIYIYIERDLCLFMCIIISSRSIINYIYIYMLYIYIYTHQHITWIWYIRARPEPMPSGRAPPWPRAGPRTSRPGDSHCENSFYISLSLSLYIYIHTQCVYIYIYTYDTICIYIERERESGVSPASGAWFSTRWRDDGRPRLGVVLRKM